MLSTVMSDSACMNGSGHGVAISTKQQVPLTRATFIFWHDVRPNEKVRPCSQVLCSVSSPHGTRKDREQEPWRNQHRGFEDQHSSEGRRWCRAQGIARRRISEHWRDRERCEAEVKGQCEVTGVTWRKTEGIHRHETQNLGLQIRSTDTVWDWMDARHSRAEDAWLKRYGDEGRWPRRTSWSHWSTACGTLTDGPPREAVFKINSG